MLISLGFLGVGFSEFFGFVVWMVVGGIGIVFFLALVDEIVSMERQLSFLFGVRIWVEVLGV